MLTKASWNNTQLMRNWRGGFYWCSTTNAPETTHKINASKRKGALKEQQELLLDSWRWVQGWREVINSKSKHENMRSWNSRLCYTFKIYAENMQLNSRLTLRKSRASYKFSFIFKRWNSVLVQNWRHVLPTFDKQVSNNHHNHHFPSVASLAFAKLFYLRYAPRKTLFSSVWTERCWKLWTAWNCKFKVILEKIDSMMNYNLSSVCATNYNL